MPGVTGSVASIEPKAIGNAVYPGNGMVRGDHDRPASVLFQRRCAAIAISVEGEPGSITRSSMPKVFDDTGRPPVRSLHVTPPSVERYSARLATA